MAKRSKKAAGEPASRDLGPSKAIDEAERSLRESYEIGRGLNEKAGIGTPGRPDHETESREAGRRPRLLRELALLARSYDPGQFEELCKLRTPRGTPLSWRVVRQLMRIGVDQGREDLQRRAAEQGWTQERLKAEIPSKVEGGRRGRRGGRPFARSSDLGAALIQVAQHGEKWMGRYSVWTEEAWYKDLTRAAEAGDAVDAGAVSHERRAEEALALLARIQGSVADLAVKLAGIGGRSAIAEPSPKPAATPAPRKKQKPGTKP